MTEIHITNNITIYNDMPRGWIAGKDQPLWHKKAYMMWINRWNLCKNPKHFAYENYKDCGIHEDFKYLSKFVDWLISEPRFNEFCETCDKIKWSVDKDSKDPNNRNYYPQYMTLTTGSENSKEMINRCGTPKSKTPVIAMGKNNKILLFKSTLDAKDKGFNSGNISKCLNKKLKTHKGYKWYKVNYKHNLRLRRVQ